MAEANKKDVKSQAGEEPQNDDELDNLLDSALDDFTKLEKPKTIEKNVTEDSSSGSGAAEAEQKWAEIINQALGDIDPAVRDMLQQGSSSDSTFSQDFSKIAEAAAKAMDGENPGNFADIMSETLKNLNEASQSIQNQFGNPEDLAGMFQELGLNGAGTGLGTDGAMDEMPAFMQTLMQSFLSKDILYPAVKEFVEKYPAWLESNKETLPAEQWDNYNKQLEVMRKLVEEFEAELETDSDETKRQRFLKIMELMQQMQSYGQPPAELISTDGEAPMDEAAMANFIPPGMDPNQCSLM